MIGSSTGFQAIVLAGGVGNRMREITDCVAKCLLPVAGIPMFWYPLNMLSRHNITDVILVTSTKTLAEVKALLHHDGLPAFPTPLNLEVVGTDLEETGEVLDSIKEKIKTDFIVLSGDFVSDISLHPMLNVHRASDAWLTCLLADNVVTGPIPGPKVKRNKGRDLIALSETDSPYTYDSQLIHMINEEEIEEDVPITSGIFDQYPKVTLTAKYNDCHVYIFKHDVLKLIEKEDDELTSIKNDIVPFVLERQYCPLQDEEKPNEPAWSAHARALSKRPTTEDNNIYIKCMAYKVTPENGTFVAHLNKLGSYLEANRSMSRALKSISPGLSLGQKLDKAMSDNESFVSEGTTLGAEKVILKKSTIGTKCTVESGVKITASLIMDNVRIGEGAQINNCIICPNVEIGANAVLNNCIVAKNEVIEAGAQCNQELIKPEEEMEMD